MHNANLLPIVLTGKKKMVTIATKRTEVPTASRVSQEKINTTAIKRAIDALTVFLNCANSGSDDLNRANKFGLVAGGVVGVEAAAASFRSVCNGACDEDDSVGTFSVSWLESSLWKDCLCTSDGDCMLMATSSWLWIVDCANEWSVVSLVYQEDRLGSLGRGDS